MQLIGVGSQLSRPGPETSKTGLTSNNTMGPVRSQPKVAGYPDNRIIQDRIKEAPLYMSSKGFINCELNLRIACSMSAMSLVTSGHRLMHKPSAFPIMQSAPQVMIRQIADDHCCETLPYFGCQHRMTLGCRRRRSYICLQQQTDGDRSQTRARHYSPAQDGR